MKRAFTFILVVCTLLLLAACGNNSQPDSVCQHTFDQWVVEKQATCKEEGLLTRSCTKCNYMEATKIEKTNDHTEVIDPEVPATCEKTGLSEGKHCAVCGKVFVAQQETPIVAHTYSDKYDESCNVCGHIRDAECTHKETEVIAGKAATCTEIGLTAGSKCKKCGEILVAQTTIPVIDHTESDWIVDTEATPTTEGKKHTECTVCGVRIAEDSIPATGSVGLSYTLNSDEKSYAVTGRGTCTDTDIVIPDTYNGLPVTSIGEFAFQNCTSLQSIAIPDSVTSIGIYAFSYCDSLTGIWVSENNPAYSSDNMGVLFNKNKSELLRVPGGLKGAYTFPDSVTSIGESAFCACSGLQSITIPDSVTFIGDYAFYYCSGLTGIWVSENNSAYSSDNMGVLFNKEQTELIQAPDGLKGAYAIPNSVTTIGSSAFSYCDSLTSVTIGDSVTTIGKYAFRECTSLTSVTIGDSVTTIGYAAFTHCTSLTSVTIGDSVTTIGNSAFHSCTSLTSVTIPDSVTTIGGGAFFRCISLTSVTIGDGVTIIGDYAFYECTSLTSVTIPDSVTTIGWYAFEYCASLTSVTIGESVTTIGGDAFSGCTSLTSVTIGDSVTTIGDYAFAECTGLTGITFQGTTAQWMNIKLGYGWNLWVPATKVSCSNGSVSLK